MDPTLLIGDIVERDTDSKHKPVQFPSPSSSTGFPQHKRQWKSSAFMQRRAANASGDVPTQKPPRGITTSAPLARFGMKGEQSFEEAEMKRIHDENRQKIASMSPEEIAQAQDDILNGLNPSLVQRLLRRANIDETNGPSPFDAPQDERQGLPRADVEQPPRHAGAEPPAAADADAADASDASASTERMRGDDDMIQEPTRIPTDLFPITDPPSEKAPSSFPDATLAPDVDPSDPNFLSALHEKYFPDLPAEPSKLAWMAPVPSKDSPADKESPYYPHSEIALAALRFDFRGRFLSPRVSRSIPSTKGLHHHGEAPEAAGYTIAELARLARSAVPAQRCMAYQTLGRILFRLGNGEWGRTQDDPIAGGVWDAMKKGRVLDSLHEASAGEGGHLGSRAYAVEALWLFEKGGWKESHRGR
ncbi:hypothetical protein DCS_01875 [Drechmeria coniospora]|uniref:Transcription factor Rba50 n=1 Tax=Drechmeria coniospora TaxID=98403 RepID=A0A151GUG3_DRECN|nr:hypothetical protein DCS_01875 [Drechmeria coniospora]KYK60737.1 hypothetical protein DCS_01875 [Drechmeria coniospora]